ncbi:MAG: response regulator [Gammaproteobacteria bacterium]
MNAPPLKKILHVDDSDDIRELVRHGLERDGRYTLMFCASAAEALDRAPAFTPDLLLLDSIMPDISGVGLYEQLRAQPGLANTPVIFLTTQAETLDFTSFLRVGAIDVIGKPFDVATLADTVEEIWREHWARQG